MFRVKKTDYIVGLWMVERVKLGKAYVYAIQGSTENSWTIHKKHVYQNESYNMFINDNNHKNTHPYDNLSEIDIIKLCNQHAGDLFQLFDHYYFKELVGGNYEKYNEVAEKNDWFPPIFIEEEIIVKENPKKKRPKTRKN